MFEISSYEVILSRFDGLFAILYRTMFKSKPKVVIACILALVLITASIIIRLVNTQKINSQLAYVDNTAQQQNNLANSTNEMASSTDLSALVTNQTDLVSQKLFANFAALQSSGNLNPQTITDLADNIASGLDTKATIQYKISDLNLINNASTKEIKDYANKFWTIRQKYMDLYSQNPIGSANFATDPLSSSFGSGFTATGDLYIKAANELSKLSIPSELAGLHLKLLNNYAASGQALKKLAQINTDSISAISGISTFSQYSDYEDIILSTMAQYFSESGIIFSNNEPGFGWNSI